MKSATAFFNGPLQRLVLENLSDIIVSTDLEFRIQSWNHVAEEFYGIPSAEAIGKQLNDLVSLSYRCVTRNEAIEALRLKKKWQGEVSFPSPTGETCYFLHTVKYITDQDGQEIGILAVGRNITDQKKAEEKLAKSEQFYRALIANSLEVILLLNAAGEITFASPSVKDLLGYDVHEAMGTNGFGYIHPNDLSWAIQSFEKEIEEAPEIKFIIIRLRKKSGEWLWCMVRGHNLLKAPQLQSIAVYIHDDTPRKLATDALKESEKRFRKLMHELQTGVLLMDADGEIVMVNNEATRIFETTEEQLVGRKMPEVCDDVIHEDGRPFLLSERPTFMAVQTRHRVKDVVMGIWNKRRKERRWLLINADPVEDNEGRLQSVISTFTDITERKKLERKSIAEKIAYQRQIAQATIDGQEKERIEMGRELHDNVGQQLTSIKLFLDLAKTSSNDETRKLLETALKSVSNVIDEVRFMSRSLVPPTLKDLGLVESVNDLIESLRTTQPLGFELTYTDLDENRLPENKKLALFRIIQEQLNNVLKYASAQNVTVALCSSSSQILLEIKDDGLGFDLGNVRRGMGLSNIINRSELFGGRVEINTAPGKGCSVKVWLPHSAMSVAE